MQGRSQGRAWRANAPISKSNAPLMNFDSRKIFFPIIWNNFQTSAAWRNPSSSTPYHAILRFTTWFDTNCVILPPALSQLESNPFQLIKLFECSSIMFYLASKVGGGGLSRFSINAKVFARIISVKIWSGRYSSRFLKGLFILIDLHWWKGEGRTFWVSKGKRISLYVPFEQGEIPKVSSRQYMVRFASFLHTCTQIWKGKWVLWKGVIRNSNDMCDQIIN